MNPESPVKRVLVARALPAGCVDALIAAGVEVEVNASDAALPREQLIASARGCSGLLTTLTERVDAELLDAAGTQLKVVANCAVGYHNIDVEACRARGVTATNTPGVLTDATADFAFALLLAAARRLVEGDRFVRAGVAWDWSPTFMLGSEVTGASLGVLGFGRIGRAVARRAAGFDMAVSYYKPSGPDPSATGAWRPVDQLLATSTHLVVCCPLNAQTHHLLDETRLRLLPRGATVVSITAGVVDEAALAALLAEGHIAAAAVDNHEHEPEVDPGLLADPRAILTPHLGSATDHTRRRMGDLAVANVLAVLNGEKPPTPVTPWTSPRP